MTSESIGPYRVLSRRLQCDVERLVAETPGGQRVVLRRRGSAPIGPAPVAEAVAFARADHPHVATLVDVLNDSSGRLVLVFDDVGADPLSSWLASRGRPEVGEAITLVVPVLRAVQHLARRGVALADLAVDDVEIDRRGAPVLVGVSPGAVGPDAEQASLPVVAGFARSMVERAAWPAFGCSAPALDSTSFESLVESMFDLGEAVPLSSVDGVDGVDGVVGAGDGIGETLPMHRPEDDQGTPGWLAFVPESEVVDRLISWLRAARPGTALAGLRRVRPRFRLLGAAAVVVGGAAVASGVASSGAEAVSEPGSGHGSPRVMPTASVAPSPLGETPGGRESAAVPSPTAPRPEATVADELEGIILGDDAVAAAELLLSSRLECLRDVTPSCLEAVDQPGSPIALRDSAVFGDPSRAGEASVRVELTGETSTTGGTVMLSATGPDGEPASVLVMRTEAGWRLRDVFVAS